MPNGNSTSSSRANDCPHSVTRYERIENDDGSYEIVEAQDWTYADLDVGRYYCTSCRAIFYYTGLWRAWHLEGIPCSGSDGVTRDRRRWLR